jgi:hypothetical protein
MNADVPITPRRGSEEFADLTRITMFFGIAVAVATAITIWYAATFSGLRFGGVVLWALALFATGAGVGFLFGIPRVLQRERSPAPARSPSERPAGGGPVEGNGPSAPSLAYHQRVNTNLEEISDWLTKIIVGVSLIQLRSIPDHLRRLADLIGASLNGTASAPDRGFGVSLVLFYATTGFLYGYLATRLYVQGALARAERGIEEDSLRAERELRTQSDKVVKEFEEALRQPAVQPAAALEGAQSDEIDAHLRALADEYLSVHLDDWTQRVRKKDSLAAEMGAYVSSRGISRDKLAGETNEGLLLALAAAVHGAPEPADTGRLVKAAYRVSRLHVQYRFVLAFARLLERGYVTPEQKAAIRAVLNVFESRADDSLRQAITGLRRQLG